jgi:hypothetical protein
MRFDLRPLLLVALIGSASVWAQPLPKVDIHKSPSCDCCAKWIAHMRKNGFNVEIHEEANISASRKKLGMPDEFGSCHTSKIGNYVVEGHVPAADIKQLLKEKPKALGLAVPSMPPGSPGMDIPHSPPYETLLVQADGSSRVYAKH